ncbi:Plasmodium vivax Vir protein, putative [Plasmodium vivax]|nr:Plasmodium vivax Vir protein, putative [Plasmodium vivax]
MSDNKLDIEEWKRKYYFLEEFWRLYDNFDKDVEGDKYKYDGVCTLIMRELGHSNEDYKNFCLKLVRNLGRYSDDNKFLRFTSDYCSYLNTWVYYSKNKYSIPDNIIVKCYQDYNEIARKGSVKTICPYYPYDDIYEPINIIMLNLFEFNFHELISILNKETNVFIPPSQNFVCELVKIYNNMNSQLCAEKTGGDAKKIKTCEILENFYKTYMWYFFKNISNNNNIPSLDKGVVDYLAMCPKDKLISRLTSDVRGRLPVLETLNGIRIEDADEKLPYEGAKDYSRDFTSSTEAGGENQVSPMSRTVSTAVGTVAGASSVLALLYKFSPKRRLLHSGIRGNRGRMNSNFYEDRPTELLFDGFQGEDMISYNTAYNVGYGSA